MTTQSNGSPTHRDRRQKACREPSAAPAVSMVKKIRLKNNISALSPSITTTAANCSFAQGKILISSTMLISLLLFCALTTSCGSTYNLSRGVKQQQQQVSNTPPLQPNSYNDTKKSSLNTPRSYFYYNASAASLFSSRNRSTLESDRDEINNRSKEKEGMDPSFHRGNVFISLINDNDDVDATLADYKSQKQPSTTTEAATTIAFGYNPTNKTINMTSFTNGTLVAFPGSNSTRKPSGGVSLDLSPSPFSGYRSKFTVDELLEMRFEHRISNDIYMDPCKAGGFLDDIALPNPENERELQLQNIKDALYLLNHPEKLQEKAPSRSTYHKLSFPDDSSTSPSRASAGDIQEFGSHEDDATESGDIRPEGDRNSENPHLFLHPRVSAVISSAAERRDQKVATSSHFLLSTSGPSGNVSGTETLGNYIHEINNLEGRNTSRNRPHSSSSRRRGRKRNHRKHHGHHHHEGNQSHRHFSGLHHERNLRLAQERLMELERLSETPISSSLNSSNGTLSPPLDLLRLSLDNHYHELEALEEKSEDDEVIEQKKFLSEQIEVFNEQLSVNSDLKLLQSHPDLFSVSAMQRDQPHMGKIGEDSLEQQEYQDDGGTSYSVDHSNPNVNKRDYRLPPPYDKTYSSASSKNREHRRNRYGEEDPLVHEGFLSQIDRSHDNLETSPEKKLEMSTEEPYEDENKSKVDKSISSHVKVEDHPDKFSPESELMIIRKNNLRKARLERRKHRKFHRESAKKSKRAKILNKPPKESKYSSSQAYYNDRGDDIYDEYGRRRNDRRGDIYNNYFSEDRPYDGYSYKDAHGRNQFHNNRLNDSDQHQSRSNGLDGGLIPFYSSEKLRGKLPDSFYEKEQFEVPQQRGYFTPNEQESNKEEEPKLVNKEHSPGSIMRRKLARRNHRVKSHSSRRYHYPWEDARRKNRNSRRKNRDRSRRKNKNRNHSGRWNRKGYGDRNFDRNYDSDEFTRRRGSDRPGDRHDYGPLGVPWEKKGRDRSGYRREDDHIDDYGIHDNRRDHTRPDGLDNMGRLDHRELDRGMRRLDDVRDRDLSRTDHPDKYHRFDQRDPLRPLDNRDSFRPGDHRDAFHDINRPGLRDPLRPGDHRDTFRPDDHIDPLRADDHRNPLRPGDERDPFRPDDHRDPFRTDDHRDPLRPDDRRDPFRPIDHRDPLRPIDHRDPLRPIDHRDPLRPIDHRPDDHRDPYNMDNHRDPLRPDLHNDPYRINEDRAILHTAGHIGDPFRTDPASFSSDVHDRDPFRSDVERDRYRPDGGPRDPFRSDGTRDPYRTDDLRDRSDLMDPYRRDSHRSDYQRELTWSDDPKSYPKGHTDLTAAPQPTLVPSLMGDDPHVLTKSLENGESSHPDLKQTTDSSNGTLLTSANKSKNYERDIAKSGVTNSTSEGHGRDSRSDLVPMSSSARSTSDDLRLKVRSVGQRIAQRRRTRAARDRRCPNQKRCPGKSRRSRRAATARKERVWDFGVIPYIIDANFTGADKGLFKRAMRHWENYTCVKFVEKTDDHPNYIIFTVRECGCCSFVGKRGNGPQAISIGKNCDKFGIVVHELGHVVGFWHEHTRPDRENHVEIIRENIQAGQDYNFNKLTGEEVNSLGQRYDFGSIMHYARATFAKATYLDTIRPRPEPGLDSLPEIGQRVKLSEGDISQTNLLYKCPKCGRTFQDNSGELRSPLYPNASPPPEGERCEWRITATHGEKIVLNITALDIFKTDGCKTDYLEIRDGVWHKDPLLGRLCGSLRMPRHLVSHGSRLLVTYVTSQNQNGHRGFDAHYEAVCGGELAQEGGHLESPNYPDDYRPDKECVWLITVPDGFQVALRFHSFEIENHDECVYDYLDIRDGHSENDTLIGVFCGYKTPEDVKSKANKMRIKFVTDGSVQKAGFSATFMKEYDECSSLDHGCEHHCINQLGGYECQCNIGYELHSDGRRCEDACGGQIESSNGSITSPSFPDLYPINKNCIWEIMAPPQYRITLNFTHFDLEGNNQDCEYDSVEIRSRMGDTELRKHGIYCGQQLPPVVTSDGNSLRVEFTSDNSVQKSGFAAVYFTDKDECASDNGGCQHICKNSIGSYQCSCHNGFTLHENGHDCKEGGCKHELTASIGEVFSPNYPDYYPSRKNCVWHFTTTPGHRIKLVFDEFEMEPHQECTYDYIIIFDGTSPKAAKLGRYCGAKVPHPIVASTNQMFMIFKSDSSVQRKGFRARHTTVCGGHLQAGVGAVRHMYSHAKYGDQNYDNKEDCDWIIEAPSEKNVHLTFLTFEVEDEHDCGYDYVEVFSGYDDTGPSYGKFCGNSIPQEIVSINEALLVRFRSDDTINTKGFSAAYVAIHEEDSSENTTGDQSTFSYSFSRGYK